MLPSDLDDHHGGRRYLGLGGVASETPTHPGSRRQALMLALGLFLSIHASNALPSQDVAIHIVTAEQGHLRQLQRDEAELLFLGRRTTAADGTPVILIDLPAGPIRDRFYLLLTGKNPQQTRAYWSRQVFTGRARPPLEALSIEQAIEWLLQTPGTVAYLPASNGDARLRVLMRLQ